jgi:uracil-DNA glycosylase
MCRKSTRDGHALCARLGEMTLSGFARVRAEAARCRNCDLWKHATQTVFGEGPAPAGLMLVGEQPGDQEDLAGRPFVGPAGAVLDRALEAAGIERSTAYVTGVVKHFKWERGARGQRRIHKKAGTLEIAACRPWLEAELTFVRPRVVVCLGATAAQALLGRSFRLTQHRGEAIVSDWAPTVLATIHPAAVLRAPDAAARAEAERGLTDDLALAAGYLRRSNTT